MTGVFTMQVVLGVIGGGIGLFCIAFVLYWKLLAKPGILKTRGVKRVAREKQSRGLSTLNLQRQNGK